MPLADVERDLDLAARRAAPAAKAGQSRTCRASCRTRGHLRLALVQSWMSTDGRLPSAVGEDLLRRVVGIAVQVRSRQRARDAALFGLDAEAQRSDEEQNVPTSP